MPSTYEIKVREVAEPMGMDVHCRHSGYWYANEKRTYQVFNGNSLDSVPVGNRRGTPTNAWRSAWSELKKFIDGKKSTPHLEESKFISYPRPPLFLPRGYLLPSAQAKVLVADTQLDGSIKVKLETVQNA